MPLAHDRERGFYSAYFLVCKKTRDFRPIVDLRGQNRYIARKTFRMLTVKQIQELVQPGDWFTTIDLKVDTFQFMCGHGPAVGGLQTAAGTDGDAIDPHAGGCY